MNSNTDDAETTATKMKTGGKCASADASAAHCPLSDVETHRGDRDADRARQLLTDSRKARRSAEAFGGTSA